MTEWRAIPGWEGLYEVSDAGDVRSLTRVVMRGGHPMKVRGKVLSPAVRSTGYLTLSLARNGTVKQWEVHRAVASAFIGELPKGKVTRHRNGNHLDNNKTNLEYGTQKQNLQDAVRHGTMGSNINRLTECHKGHPFDSINTYVSPKSKKRSCRKCKADRQRARITENRKRASR